MTKREMTKRERYLKAVRNEATDELVWAPNFDYWYWLNKNQGTLPEKYREMSINDIAREIGGYIWKRAAGLKKVVDISVRESVYEKDGDSVSIIETPVGSIRQVYTKTESEHSSKFLKEHYVKDIESLKVMKYIFEATHYEGEYEPVFKALAETGDDGIVLHQAFSVPFIHFAKTDVGYQNAFYLWNDYREEVDEYLQVVSSCFLQGYVVLAEGPADLISTGDNMDGTMISPAIFKEYAIPFYREAGKILAAKGKVFQGHWCGRTQNLLHLVPGSGLDGVEAIVTKPMADIDLSKALDLLGGKAVLQGGIPAVLVCNEGGTAEEFEKYIKEVILPLKARKGFILGMGDNVPPNADFSRVEAVAKLI